MNINHLELIESLYSTPTTQALSSNNKLSPTISDDNDYSFSDILNQSLNHLENTQLASDYAVNGLASGEADNLHNVMITTTEAQLTLELAVELRNRTLEAMNEIKNMQF